MKEKKDKERAAAQAAAAMAEEPFFELHTLKSRTVQIMLFSAALAYAGINAPLFLLVSHTSCYMALCIGFVDSSCWRWSSVWIGADLRKFCG